jgi:hypothetical protein
MVDESFFIYPEGSVKRTPSVTSGTGADQQLMSKLGLA